MLEMVLASHNPDKLAEFEQIFAGQVKILQPPPRLCEQVEETGKTYAENAGLKARAIWTVTGGYVLADDSGLSVDILDGYPGIYSARFAGENASYPDKIQRLWDLLSPYPQQEWTASFICALAFIEPTGQMKVFSGEVKGLISSEIKGENGFGYDPIFYLPELGQTTAELTPAQKHQISHRGRAVENLQKYLKAEGLIKLEGRN